MKRVKAEVKTEVKAVVDFRVWCEHCSIRIAPHEEKIAADGKTYHQRCYSRLSAGGPKAVPGSLNRPTIIEVENE
jgi:hypothetical protein